MNMILKYFTLMCSVFLIPSCDSSRVTPFEQSKNALRELLNASLGESWEIRFDGNILVLKTKSPIRLINKPPSSPVHSQEELHELSFLGHKEVRFRVGERISQKDYETMYAAYREARKTYEKGQRELASKGIRMGKGQLYPKGEKQERMVAELQEKFSTQAIRYPDYWYENLSVYSLFTNYDNPLDEKDMSDMGEVLDETFCSYKLP